MEKSFDEITVSSLSDLQLGSSSEYPSHLAPGSSGGDQQQVQQRNSSGAGNGNENNLNRQKRSSKHQQQQQQQSVFNPSRHLDVWLANAIRGLENANSGGQDGAGSDLLDSPTLLKGSFGERCRCRRIWATLTRQIPRLQRRRVFFRQLSSNSANNKFSNNFSKVSSFCRIRICIGTRVAFRPAKGSSLPVCHPESVTIIAASTSTSISREGG